MMGERLGVAPDSGDQEDERSCFSNNTRSDFIYVLRGIRNVWFSDVVGSLGAGSNELVRQVDPALDDRITALTNVAEAAIADIDQPSDAAVASSEDREARDENFLWHGGETEAVRAAFVAMQRADREALLDFLGSL